MFANCGGFLAGGRLCDWSGAAGFGVAACCADIAAASTSVVVAIMASFVFSMNVLGIGNVTASRWSAAFVLTTELTEETETKE